MTTKFPPKAAIYFNSPLCFVVLIRFPLSNQLPIYYSKTLQSPLPPSDYPRCSVGWRREEVSCTAMVGSCSGKTVLKRLVVAAHFIRPGVQLSRREITFERRREPGKEFTEQMTG